MQLRLKLFVVAAMATVLAASSAMAATVTFTMHLNQDGPGTFNLYADASTGDNAGIASYGIPLVGPITSLDHNSTKSLAASGAMGFGPAGFTSLRSADGNPVILASQDTITPTPNLIYGIGQTGGSFAGLGMTSFDPQTEGNPWNAHFRIASGSYNADLGRPDFVPGSFDLFSNVFNSPNSSTVTGAEVVLQCIGCDPPPPGFEVEDLFLGGALPGKLITGGPLPTNATDPNITWALQGLSGPDGSILGASVDPSSGVFSWQSQASSTRGGYTATIQGTNTGDPSGLDTGSLTFNLVPEPSALALLGVGMVGLFGIGRRRGC